MCGRLPEQVNTQHAGCLKKEKKYKKESKDMLLNAKTMEFSTSPDEMCISVGILLLLGYNSRVSKKDNWSEAADLQAECVQNAMPRNQYRKLKSVLHSADNNTSQQQGHMIVHSKFALYLIHRTKTLIGDERVRRKHSNNLRK